MWYAVVIENSAAGYGAYVLDLPGCVAVGENEEEVRENTRMDQQREKLLALGRLSAGLAHELNNPAAAARRAAAGLGEALRDMRERTAALAAWLGELVAGVPHEAVIPALGWTEATLRSRQLLEVVEGSTTRISELVGAVKTYTYMDQAGVQEVDVHRGLESTLTMLGHKLRGVTVERDYAPDLPRIQANGSKLNQVWTNLLDNAADAAGSGGRIGIVTRPQDGGVRVEVTDSGRGIPPELLEQIWEPFFTTKPVGEGTGLGLEIARRIVVGGHGGQIRVHSQPGETRFTVVLPPRRPGA